MKYSIIVAVNALPLVHTIHYVLVKYAQTVVFADVSVSQDMYDMVHGVFYQTNAQVSSNTSIQSKQESVTKLLITKFRDKINNFVK